MKGKYLVFASSIDFYGKIYFNEDETSYYNLRGNYIVIGRKNYERDSQIKGLIAHEVGHYHFTSDETEKIEELGVPFALVNILEDARIEKIMSEKYSVGNFFAALHRRSYELYYENEPEAFRNPYNVGVLLRWKRYIPIPEERIQKIWEDEFISDWKTAIKEAETAKNIAEVVDIAYRFFVKWKERFSSTSPVVCISPEFGQDGEKLGEALSGRAEKEEENKASGKLPPAEDFVFPESVPVFNADTTELYELDASFIRSEGKKLSRYLRKPLKELSVYAMCGNRPNPRKFVFPSVKVFKKRVRTRNKKIKVLLLLDRSGSMSGVPAQNSDTIASILEHAGLKPDIVVSSTEFAYRVLKSDDLPKIECSGGEGFGRIESFLKASRYDLVIVMSDLYINRFSEKVLKDLKKVYGGKLTGVYVGDEKPHMEMAKRIFGKNFIYRPSLEGIARILGLLILRSL